MKNFAKIILLSTALFFWYAAHSQCPDSVNASFINVTPAPNPGCNSTTGVFQNTSGISLSNVQSFVWTYGDGTTASGTEDSSDLWSSTSHNYTTNGGFNVELAIISKTGCSDSFVLENAVINVIINPSIISNQDVYTPNDMPICFDVAYSNSIGIGSFLWNFGDPPSGNTNFENRTLTPCHSFGLGPHMISLRIQAGPCDVIVYDTFQVVGPAALIEIPYNRIAETEKFQCGTSDSIHFTNASLFYQNDNTPSGEDSIVVVNGKSLFAFNYTPPTGGSSAGIGDQTALTSATHIANRTMGSQVWRIWEFGDQYAPQCTTSLAKGQNVGVNCNYSEDELPVHKYQSWDSIYYNHYFLTNQILNMTKYNEVTNQCYIDNIDTSNAQLHRKIFDKTIQNNYAATLTLHDTISGVITSNQILIDFRRPDASKMKLVNGAPCPYDGNNLNYVQHFDLNTDGQSYFAVNFDTLYNDPSQSSSWSAYNSGQVLAPPAPGQPIPFVLPYAIAGTPGDEFVKEYSPGQLGNPDDRTPQGAISLGIIVGNGPAIPAVPGTTPGSPATCLDTAYYHNIVNIKPLDASFDMLLPTGASKEICAGEDAYFKLNTEIQNGIKFLRFDKGYNSNGYNTSPGFGYYLEEFEYMQAYNGPSPTRNDFGIAYNGEDWYYNYVVRSNHIYVSNKYEVTVLDTIVTSIVKDWKIEVELSNPDIQLFSNANLGYNNIPEEHLYKLLGDGTNGCIDTTGLSGLIEINLVGYSKANGDETIMHGDKRYRYTNASKTDSIEVAHILHFRDSSLQGYDTLIVGTDTTLGVWKHSYTYQDSVGGQLQDMRAIGAMFPGFIISNIDGCDSRSVEQLAVGYLNTAFASVPRFKDEAITFIDSLRYFQYGNPVTWPIDPANHWNNPGRIALGLESFKVDWDASDGLNDWKTGINRTLNNTYTQTGDYTITMASKNINNCRDTFAFDITVVERPFATADFIDSVYNPWDCNADILFSDLSFITDATCGNATCDSAVAWSWTFGNGVTSTDQNPLVRVDNAQDMVLAAKLVITSANGLKDSAELSITVYAGTPPNKPNFDYSVNDKTLTADVVNSDLQSKYDWAWGDGSTDEGKSSSNTYASNGLYNTTLTRTDTVSECSSDSVKSINIGGCNAYFGYEKDSSATYAVLLLDSSAGTSLSYLWNWGDGNTSTGSRPSHDYDTFGQFLVALTVSNTNCSSTYSDSIGMDANGTLLKKDGFSVKVGTAGVSETNTILTKVYPNPTSGTITTEIQKGRIETVEVYTLDGKKQSSTYNQLSTQKWQVRLPEVSGTYVLVILSTDGRSKQIIEVR